MSDSSSLTDNLTWPNEFLKDFLVDGGESSGSRSLLLLGAGVSRGFRKDFSLGEEDDEFVGKLFLEFSGKSESVEEAIERTV